MDLMLNLNIPKSPKEINHQHKILSVGSCFTEHIGNALVEYKFDVLQNPNGILFDPMAVCSSLVSYIQQKQYTAEDLFSLNELWHSWNHHSRFSHTDPAQALKQINASQQVAYQFLREADWLIITLGSAFSYKLVEQNLQPVANCHRAPAQWFQKHLSTLDEIIARLDNTIHQLFHFNRKLNIIFTISPVRHIRDGVVDNNRSKARLIEAVHHLVNKFDKLFYFPSYELVIDILRDYRFYAEDMVHPNYLATDFVLEHFTRTYMSDTTLTIIEDLKKLAIARKHRSAHPGTEAHKKFLESYLVKAQTLQEKYPYLKLEQEIDYFSAPR
jgi:hypothetical protein